MKNLLIYYACIALPLFAIVVSAKWGYVSSGQFFGLMAFYIIVYRTLTDYYRLKSKHILRRGECWKLLLPGSRFKYNEELYSI